VDMMRSILENYRFDLINGNPALAVNTLEAPRFSVYPNPSNGQFLISGLPADATSRIRVFDEQGQLIYQEDLFVSQAELSLPEGGVYFVSIITGESVEVKRVVVL